MIIEESVIEKTNNKRIDKEHSSIIKKINEFQEAMCSGLPLNILDDILGEIYHITKEHFSYEELLIKKRKIGDFEKHFKVHRQLLEEITNIREISKQNDILSNIKCLHLLTKWMLKHFGVIDKKTHEIFKTKTPNLPPVQHSIEEHQI